MFFFKRKGKPSGYSFFDVETPNRFNDRICSISVYRTDNYGNIVDHMYRLVDPETDFDFFNTKVHGLTNRDVLGSMNFKELWDAELSKIIAGTQLVAYNATFDMSVLCKTMYSYGIDPVLPKYADALIIAKDVAPSLTSFKLPVVCKHFGIPEFKHHDAEDDTRACMNLFWELEKRVDNLPYYFLDYTFRHVERDVDSSNYRRKRYLSDSTRSSSELITMIESAIGDGVIDMCEAMEVLIFIETHESIKDDPSVSQLSDLIQTVVMDGCIDASEQNQLNALFNRIVDPCSCSDGDLPGEFEGKKFVLSGDFTHGSKNDVGEYIEQHGGIVCKSGPSRNTDYVVVGSKGSDFYALGNYGTKVKKALDLQAKGFPVQVITEEQLYKCRE